MHEVKILQKKDVQQKILFEDINQPNFITKYSFINKDRAGKILHGLNRDDEIILGLEVTYLAWSLVGYKWLVAPLRWPVARSIFRRLYFVFAKHRHFIARLFYGKTYCSNSGRDASEG
tara:strand:- start:3252 stop:3605 length:354 start_codon:yes stop_codon:yes gene_type:complete